MAWVTSRPGDPQALLRHAGPLAAPGGPWEVSQALACGPRLVRSGKVAVSYREERLASPGPLPRTFLGYGGPGGKPTHLVLCAADGMEFQECASFLMEYFRRQYGAPCSEGMCLDGGSSTQAAWRQAGGRQKPGARAEIAVAPDNGTTVPTAILVYRDSTPPGRGLPSGSTR